MNTPINHELEKLPPIITFLTSHYIPGNGFPLSVGIFVNGKAYAFHIKPQEHWNLSSYDPSNFGNTPLSFFVENGITIDQVRNALHNLINIQKVVFFLRDVYDPISFKTLGIDYFILEDIDLLDTFKNYDERYAELSKRIETSKMNIYSVEDVVKTAAYQTFDNLQYDNLDLLRYTLFRYGVDRSRRD